MLYPRHPVYYHLPVQGTHGYAVSGYIAAAKLPTEIYDMEVYSWGKKISRNSRNGGFALIARGYLLFRQSHLKVIRC